MLSFTGKGKYSIIIAIAAPTAAIQGETKSDPARNAKIKPAIVPSNVLPLLNGNLFPIRPPNIEAALSPRAKIAMAALLAGEGKTSKVKSIPKAKYNGAAVKP